MSRWDYDSILRQWVCPRKKHQSSIFSMKKLGQTYWVCCSQLKGPTDFRRDRLWVTQLLELWPLMVGTFSFLSPRMMVGSHYYKSVPLPCKSMLYVKLTGKYQYWTGNWNPVFPSIFLPTVFLTGEGQVLWWRFQGGAGQYASYLQCLIQQKSYAGGKQGLSHSRLSEPSYQI